MDEYFCPNCGTTLNEQQGFSPDNGTWTCTVCGKLLMDDDVYEGDTYEGVAWFCDQCGSLLNRQLGFSDAYGSWTCTECGYTNGTTHGDIVRNADEFNCPNCGELLNEQICFSKYSDDWTCTSCGKKLHHDYSCEEYTVIEEEKLTCPRCGSVLEEQICYVGYEDDWQCTECGTHLHRDYSFEPYEVVDDKTNDQAEADDYEEKDSERSQFTDFVSSSATPHYSQSFAEKKTHHVQVKAGGAKQKNSSLGKRAFCKKTNRPILRTIFYINAFFLVIGLRNILVNGQLAYVRGVIILSILSGLFFVLSETPRKSKYIFGKNSGLSKRLFVWLCLIALYLLPDFVSVLLL